MVQGFRTLRARTRVLLVVVLVMGAGVLIPATHAAAACPTPPSGTWIGTWASNDALYSGTSQGQFNWSTTALTGVLDFVTGTAALNPNTPISLSVSCTTMTGTIPSNFGSIAINGTISPDGKQFSGTYLNSPPIPGGSGTMQGSAVTQTVADTGTALTTDAAQTGATPDAPLQTAIISPTPGPLQIEEALVPGSIVGGYSLLNQVVRITAPDATALNPLSFTFEIDPSATGGVPAASIAVFRNGIILGDCTGPLGTASPDPCVSSRVDLPNGNVQVSVLTSHASVWTLGTPPRTVSIGSAAVSEGQTGKPRTITFPVTLSQPAGGAVHVGYSIQEDHTPNGAGPLDYKARTGTLTFNTAKTTRLTPTTKYITTTIYPDTQTEVDETFAVDITGVDGGYTPGAESSAVGRILTDDSDPTPSVRVGDASIVEGNIGKLNTAKVSIALSDPASTIETVQVSLVPVNATPGVDYRPVKPKTVTFRPGQWQATLAIPVLPDTVMEGDEVVDIVLTNPSTGLTITRSTGTLTIVDDDGA